METMSTDNKNKAGEVLKQGRLRQRLSISECAKRTHIAPRFIEALEEEKWEILPSESHRLGFLRLYSRFLGVSTEEVITLYKQQVTQASGAEPHGIVHAGPTQKSNDKTRSSEHTSPIRTAPRPAWAPSSMPQLIGFGIALLILAWILYHAISPKWTETSSTPWTRRKESTAPRLSTPAKPIVQTHKVVLTAKNDVWIRVINGTSLLYEGILRGGSIKEWSDINPFEIKIGNIRAVSLSWNDQPYDLSVGSRGLMNTIRIPPSS